MQIEHIESGVLDQYMEACQAWQPKVLKSEEKTLFLFPGQGCQWATMGRDLLAEPVFRERIERCDQLFQKELGWSLLEALLKDATSSDLTDSCLAQPAIFAIQVALSAQLAHWGIVPDGVIGHSVGEVAAAHVAGVLDLETAVHVIACQNRIMQKIVGIGQMLFVAAAWGVLKPMLEAHEGDVTLAAVNSHKGHVLSALEGLEVLEKELTEQGLFCKMLRIDIAFHSPLIDAHLPHLGEMLGDLDTQPPSIPVYSTLRGERAKPGDFDGVYWCRHMREPVCFAQAVEAAIEDDYHLCSEIGPHPVLSQSIDDIFREKNCELVRFHTLKRNQPDKWELLFGLAKWQSCGLGIDLEKMDVSDADLIQRFLKDMKPSGQNISNQLSGKTPAWRTVYFRKLIEKGIEQWLGSDAIVSADTGFMAMGFSSLNALQMKDFLARELQLSLPSTLLFDYPDIPALVAFLEGFFSNRTETEASLPSRHVASDEPIAIVGMACRFPGGANSPELFWELLAEGRDGVGEVPGDRWDTEAFFDPDPQIPGKSYSKWGGFLQDMDLQCFDAAFFKIPPREAKALDPQHRLLLEVSWEALENSGYAPADLKGQSVGVFLGISTDDYKLHHLMGGDLGEIDAYSALGSMYSSAGGRLSYMLGLQGPNISVDTACSSSLVALHLACQSLRSGESNASIVAGVNAMLSPNLYVYFSKLGALSPSGRCRTFDASADGYTRGEGCGVLVLKRLSDALEQGDNILALVKGSAVNQDGASSSFTAPNGVAQQTVIRSALKVAGAKPSEVDYIEAHGTGTPLGDPIELGALSAVFAENRKEPLIVGSVKTNIGHLEAGAGIAGIMKIVLALNNQTIPPHLHFEQLNPHVNDRDLGMIIPTGPMPWPDSPQRLAGVSSFGFSGTNAHVLIGEAPSKSVNAAKQPEGSSLLTLSAATPEALEQLVEVWKDFEPNSVSFAQMCFTANTGRNHFKYRQAVVASDWEQARKKLNLESVALAKSKTAKKITKGKLAFVFGGQGMQYVEMGRELYQESSEFRKHIDACDAILRQQVGCTFLGNHFQTGLDAATFAEPEVTQLTVFALEFALAKVWMSWGIVPDLLIGHSLGEYVAACIAGVFSLEDGLRLVYRRAAIMSDLPEGGAMASLSCNAATVRASQKFGPDLEIATLNAPELTVVSGQKKAVKGLCAELEGNGVKCRMLPVSHAFHSELMQPACDAFLPVAESITYAQPQIPLVSNVTGKVMTQAPDGAYWCKHMRETVRFMQGLETLGDNGCTTMIEVSPAGGLAILIQRCLPEFEGLVLPSMRKRGSWSCLLKSLGSVYEHGFDIHWKAFYGSATYQKVRLPNYVFQRKRYWTEPKQAPSKAPTRKSLIGQQIQGPALGDTVLFQTVFEASQPAFLSEHRVFGHRVSPAAAHLAMMMSVAKKGLGMDRFKAVDLAFTAPLVLQNDDSRKLQCYVTKTQSGGRAFKLVSRDQALDGNEPWQEHCSALLLQPSEAEKPEKMVLDFDAPASAQGFYDGLATRGQLQLGATFQQLKTVRTGKEKVALCDIDPKTPIHNDQGIHPGLMDSLLQSMIFTSSGLQKRMLEGELFIPFTMAEFHVNAPIPPGRLQCHAQLLEEQEDHYVGDISVTAPDGRMVLEINELMIRRVESVALSEKKSGALDQWLYATEWQQHVIPRHAPEGAGHIAIFAGQAPWVEALIQELTRLGRSCIHVLPGEAFAQLGPHTFIVAPKEKSDHAQLFTKLNRQNVSAIEHVIYGWGVAAPLTETTDTAHLIKLQEEICQPLLYLTQALLETGAPAKLSCLSSSISPGSEPWASPASAPLRGLCQGLAVEYPEHWHRFIEMGVGTSSDHLAQLLLQKDGPDRLHLDATTCRYPSLKRFAFTGHQDLTFDAEGSYLVSGGTGALGLKCAQWLLEQGARHLILVSRNPSAEMESLFSEGGVHWMQADLADEASVVELMEKIHHQLPPLKGVIHAAGVLADGALLSQDWSQFEKVLAPKVYGSWNLHRHTRNLDFFVMFSSAVTLLGNRGQSNYAAANAFLDELAKYRKSLGQPAISIAWGPWAKGGMVATDPKRQRALANMGLRALEPGPCMDILHRAVAEGQASSFGVFDLDWRQFATQALPNTGFWDSWLPTLDEADHASGEGMAQTWVFDESSEEVRDAQLMAQLRESAAQTLGIPATELELEQPLMEQGFDSLMAVEMRSRLAEGLGKSLPVSLLFNHPSLNALFDFVKQTWAPLQVEPEMVSDVDSEGHLDDLNEAELEALILKDLEENHDIYSVGEART